MIVNIGKRCFLQKEDTSMNHHALSKWVGEINLTLIITIQTAALMFQESQGFKKTNSFTLMLFIKILEHNMIIFIYSEFVLMAS